METFTQFIELQKSLNLSTDIISNKINVYDKENRDLIGWDAMIISTEWKALKSAFAKEFKALQDLNKVGTKKFKKELNKYYSDKRKGV